jgi:putative ABC transport system substrate-binding protein
MKRREFISLLGGVAAAWPLSARAQQSGKVWRIGILETISPELNAANLNALRQGLREKGYVEGNNLAIEYRSADGREQRFSDFAAELVRQNVDLIVTRGTPAVLAAKTVTTTIPIVMAAIGEPLLAVASIARPGGNVTGLSAFVTELQAKRVELLKDLLPHMQRVAALLNMGNAVTPPQWKEIEAAAKLLGLKPQLLDVRNASDIVSVLDAPSVQHADALVVGIDTVMQSNRDLIAKLAIKHRLPTIYASREFVDAGGLMTYGVSYPDLYRRAATYIDKIFKGTRPADLPVEQPVKFEFVINLKTAKTIGVTIPPLIHLRADEVIE